MNKRERLKNTISGQTVDRVPIALWRYFPGDDQRAADFAQSVVEFQQTYDWDFVKVTPASPYMVTDYGVQTAWKNAASGDREIVNPGIKRSLEWTELRTLDPQRGELGKQLECHRIIKDRLDDDIPVVATIYSPLTQASQLASFYHLRRNIRTHVDRVRSGLNIITENTLRFIEALKRCNIDGISYVMQHADYNDLSEAEYAIFGVPFDVKILDEIANHHWWLNMIELRGEAPMFRILQNYAVQTINWDTPNSKPDITQGKSLILGAVCGGFSSNSMLLEDTPATLRNKAREAMMLTNGRRLILAANLPISPATPLSNLRAVRESVNTTKIGV